jgi:perosamine synthetase
MSTSRWIPVAVPMLVGNEKSYVMDCLDTTWISSIGKYIENFEVAFADYCGVGHGISCCNGTAALHLALMAFDVGPGDEVIVPTLTFVATANAVAYCGAIPLFADSEPETWNIDVAAIERLITPRTRGIIAVHLYGHPADMDGIMDIARRHGLFVIEDAAEAHGARYRDRPVGSLADVATFSFYGNKIITCGEGGMVVTDNEELAARMRILRGQGMDPQRRYWHPTIGYNYRMTNVAAAIGLAQLEQIGWHTERRLQVVAWYKARLADIEGIRMQAETPWAHHSYWMFTILLEDATEAERDLLMKLLAERGIETRPVFFPTHHMPPYAGDTEEDLCPVAARISRQGLNLPTWAGLTEDDIDFICASLRASLQLLAGERKAKQEVAILVS